MRDNEDQLRLWQHASRHGRATDAVNPVVYELYNGMSWPLNSYFISSYDGLTSCCACWATRRAARR